MIINRTNAEHYRWKDICDGWHLLKSDKLSIISECMPPNSKEDLHYHEFSYQFFYILEGEAVMHLGGDEYELKVGDGIEVHPNQQHQMMNNSMENVNFIVISSPKAHGDRVTI